MAVELHVLAGAELLETFRLTRGMHLLGSTAAADLLLSSHDSAADVCRVELGPGGRVTLRSLDDTPLRRWDGASDLEVDLRNAEFADVAGLRLLVLDRAPRQTARIQEAQPVPETAPSTGMRAPSQQPLALRVRTGGKTLVVPVDQPMITFGRGTGNTVSFNELEVSRHHARLIFKPRGPWIEDLGSGHGTFLNGAQVDAAAWPLGAQVRLSAALDAPLIDLMTTSDALGEQDLDEAVSALRGTSSGMRRVRSQILRYGEADDPLLILGETGTGKELVARALARLRGSKRPFQAINCAVSPEGLVEAQLFGYRKGAFTGAVQDQVGDFEAAGDGTLFLDEIGDMPPAYQVKILRTLESFEVQRLGETHTRRIAARVVAGTHRDLKTMVAEGRFREDLYHRLNVAEIRIPPLRDRIEDIPALARSFLMRRRGKSGGKTLSDLALEKLCGYPWPGNVRELKHAVDRAALNTDGPEIEPEALGLGGSGAAAPEPTRRGGIDDLPGYLEGLKRAFCEKALADADGNASAAARALGMTESSVRRCAARFGLALNRVG